MSKTHRLIYNIVRNLHELLHRFTCRILNNDDIVELGQEYQQKLAEPLNAYTNDIHYGVVRSSSHGASSFPVNAFTKAVYSSSVKANAT